MKTIIEKAYECFNNQDLDGFMFYIHKDIKVYDLKTNKLLVNDVETIRVGNEEPVNNTNKKIYATNVIQKDNFLYLYKTFSYRDDSEIVVIELENEKLKNVWVAHYPIR